MVVVKLTLFRVTLDLAADGIGVATAGVIDLAADLGLDLGSPKVRDLVDTHMQAMGITC